MQLSRWQEIVLPFLLIYGKNVVSTMCGLQFGGFFPFGLNAQLPPSTTKTADHRRNSTL